MAVDNKTKLLHDAGKYVLQGRIPQAIAEYLKIVRSDPNDVLTLNTIGDLYLRQGKTSEASRYFSQVAEHYARNNFLLKAIAVYKKILNAEPDNLEINRTIASLFVKQGLNLEARNQYLRLAGLCEKEGKARESLEAYEKVAEMDPQNCEIQLRLAEIHLAEGARERAQAYFAGAARAQVKAGNFDGALSSFKRAIQLEPVDIEAMKGFLDASIQSAQVSPALDQLKKSLALAPDNIPLREMLGHALLAAGDPDAALRAFELVLSRDESRHQNYFTVSRAFIKAGDYDRAGTCLDRVVPILVRRREAEKAVEAYKLILASAPEHIPTLLKLANVYQAMNDQGRYLVVLDTIAGHYLSRKSPREALEYLDKILSMTPASEKHLRLHGEAFTEAFPGMPYVPPTTAPDSDRGGEESVSPAESQRDRGSAPAEGSNPAVVEVDLLLNYGMRDRAMAMLQSMQSQEPADKEIRTRLVSLYKEDRKYKKAAEECLVLAALYYQAHNEEAARKYLTEARKLSPEMVGPRFSLNAFARDHGLAAEFPEIEAAVSQPGPKVEVDLSDDLSELFFNRPVEPELSSEVETSPEIEAAASDLIDDAPSKPPSEYVQEQLQEADFYLRLGFLAEARAKLDEISRNDPDNPELPLRYKRLSEGESSPAAAPDMPSAGLRNASPPGSSDVFQQVETEKASEQFGEGCSSPEHPAVSPASEESRRADAPSNSRADEKRAGDEPPQSPAASEGGLGPVNEMFADLIEEVNLLTDSEIAREQFDTHFSLGIAYREMELIEDAIKEFQSAYKALDPTKLPKEAVQCCGMLSTCFLEKGMPRSAIRWCHAGLEISGISLHEDLALRYEAGVAHSILGDPTRALELFDHIYSVDPSYRDVAQKIDSLRGSPDRHVP